MADQSWQELERGKDIWKQHAWFYRLLRGFVLVGIGVLIGHAIYAKAEQQEAYWINVFTSVLGIAATVLILDELNRKRLEDEYKRQLVDDAASTSNEIAKNGVHQLRRKEWLIGDNGLLVGEDLQSANLKEALLLDANLQHANLLDAKLQKANLLNAKLQNASLYGAKLDDARLEWAQMQRADLSAAQIIRTNLKGANLKDANLNGAILIDPEFDPDTTLPNGNKWGFRTDYSYMRRFTDHYHPDFWEPEWVKEQPGYNNFTY